MIKLHRGDRVRYRCEFAKCMMERAKTVDWRARVGVVANEPRDGSQSVSVLWDGTKSRVMETRRSLEMVR